MSVWSRWLLLFSLAINGGGIGAAAYIHYFVGPRPFVMYYAEKRILFTDQRLHLTPSQEKAFTELQAAFVKRVEDSIPDITQRRLALINALRQPDADQASLEPKLQGVHKVYERFYEDWVQYILQLEAVLTPEQRETFGVILNERIARPLEAPLASHSEATDAKPSPAGI